MHFQRDCPHFYENQSKQVFESKAHSANEVRNISMKDEHVLMVEAVNAAVLDCACSRNVIGKIWKDTFIASLGPDERNEVVSLPGGTSFNFGGGTEIKSIEKIKFPCVIAGTKTTIISDVVERDIPLLLLLLLLLLLFFIFYFYFLFLLVLLPITWNCRIFSFILWSGLSYFRILTICLLLVYFVSAAGCHCFDFYLNQR